MKTLSRSTTRASWAFTLYLAALSLAVAQPPSYPMGQGPFGQGPAQQPSSTPAAQTPAQPQTLPGQPATQQSSAMVRVAGPEVNAFALQSLAGKPVRGAGQVELGNVSDFLIDSKTGQLRFAVVPSGAGASGQTFRLIPIAALDATSGPDGLRITLGQAQWDQVGTMTEEQLKSPLNNEQQQRLYQQFALSQQPPAASDTPMVRATQLRGKTLTSGGQSLASVQDVAIDVRHQLAAALVTPSGSPAASAGQKFLVPFAQLQISSPEQAQINTSLTQMHFQQAQSGMPTGPGGVPFGSANSSPMAAAIAVRQAFDKDASLSQANVQVIPESRVALRGTVPSEQIRSNLERVAKEAAPGVQIDNHLSVSP